MPAIGNHLTNDEILEEIGARLRGRRLGRDTGVNTMALTSGLNRKTIMDAEAGRDGRMSTFITILRDLDLLGALDAALPDTLPGAESFTRRGEVRLRASGARGTRASRATGKTRSAG